MQNIFKEKASSRHGNAEFAPCVDAAKLPSWVGIVQSSTGCVRSTQMQRSGSLLESARVFH